MERLCYTFDLTPGMEEEYERRHANRKSVLDEIERVLGD